MKQKIELLDYIKEIMTNLSKGVLLTTKVDNKVNTMAIAWGQIGIEWNQWIFTTFVRTGRLTHEMLEQSGEFTINIPMDNKQMKTIAYCGSKSGRDCDKIKDMNFTLEDSEIINAPGIKEFPLTLECKIIYTQKQNPNAIGKDIQERFYPQHVPSEFSSSNQDFHTMFFGEIVNAYIVK